MGVDKKVIILSGLFVGLATTAYILYNSFDKLNNLDLDDPFEVELDDE